MVNLPAWKVGDRGFDPQFGLQVLKKQNISSPRKIKYCGKPPCPGGSVHGLRPPELTFTPFLEAVFLFHLTILRRFSYTFHFILYRLQYNMYIKNYTV